LRGRHRPGGDAQQLAVHGQGGFRPNAGRQAGFHPTQHRFAGEYKELLSGSGRGLGLHAGGLETAQS
jgi:hypothetical protein